MTNALIDPLTPAGTTAALVTTAPDKALSVQTSGCAVPVGPSVRYPSGPDDATDALIEYACALAATPQLDACTGKLRLARPRQSRAHQASHWHCACRRRGRA